MIKKTCYFLCGLFLCIHNISIAQKHIVNANHEYVFKYGENFIDLKDSLLDGKWIVCDNIDTTRILLTGQYENYKKEGKWNIYYPTGMKYIEYYYQNNLYNGPFFSWYKNGNIRSYSMYRNNHYSGINQMWYKNGVLKYSKYWESDRKEGKSIEYYENGQIKIKQYFENNVPVKEYTEYYENGRLKKYGVFTLIKEYQDTFVLVIKSENRSCFDSIEKLYYNQEEYAPSDMAWYSWHKDGIIKTTYKKQDSDTVFYEYFNNGELKTVGTICYGEIKQENTMKYCNCKYEMFTGFFKQGQWKYFNKSGELIREEIYKDGKLEETINVATPE
jgi:antitoxin component YwqK of YwqJK toxin-antitoxin module